MKQSFWGRIAAISLAAASWCLIPMVAAGQAASAPAAQSDATKVQAAKPTPHLADGHPDLNGDWYRPLLFLGAGEKEGDTLKYVPKANPAFVAAIKPYEAQYAPPYKAELQTKVKQYDEQQVKFDPGFSCKPPGVPRIGPPHKIVQTRNEVIFLYSDLVGNFWRVIPTDGRPHRTDADPSYLGDSVGRWEESTLVVDSNNFTEDTWLADNGMFHSDALHVIERLTRQGDTILYEVTVDDPKVFTKPWVEKPRTLTLLNEPLDEAPPCVEKDAPNMVGLQHHGNPR